MPQLNSILNLLNITDTNIKYLDSMDKIIYPAHQKLKIKVIEAKLSYTLVKCPSCGFDTLIKNGSRKTDIRLGSLIGSEYHLKLWKQRYQCKQCHATCGAHTNLVKPNQSMSVQIDQLIIPLAKQSLTIKSIAQIIGVSANKQFSFMACDADSHKILALLPERTIDKISEHFIREYSLQERQQVETICMDLNANYQKLVRQVFPDAKIIVDRFHIIQLVGRALDKARLAALSAIDDKKSREYKALKSQWKMFHLFEDELDQSNVRYIFGINERMTQQNLIDIGLDVDSKFKEVYQTYQNILRAVKYKDPSLIEQTLREYKNNGTTLDIAISTLKKNMKHIVNSCKLPYSNGPLE